MSVTMHAPTRDLRDDLRDNFVTQQRALNFCKWLSCYVETNGSPGRASERFLQRYPDALTDSREIVTKSIAIFEKAAVAPGDTVNPSWAGALYGVAKLLDAFIAIARSASLIGRIPNLRMIPFHVRVPVQSQAANYYWVQQGQLKPIARLQFDPGVTLGPTKIEGIVIETLELVRLTAPGMDAVLRDELINGLTASTDQAFLDPASAPIADTRPGAITSGVTPTAATGNLRDDVGALVKDFYEGRPGAKGVLILSEGVAAQLVGVDGNPDSAYRMPLITTAAAGDNVIALDPQGVCVADGGVAIDATEQAAVEMDDAPDGTHELTSLWQKNLVGIKVERMINWEALPNAVKYLTVS